MSTHNIDFYEDLTKIIFELSSNIIKYAPYFFCCPKLCSAMEKKGVARAVWTTYFVSSLHVNVLCNMLVPNLKLWVTFVRRCFHDDLPMASKSHPTVPSPPHTNILQFGTSLKNCKLKS